MSSTSFRCLLTAALLLAGGPALALSLGEARSNSSPGERLVAEIDFTLDSDESLEAGCIHFAKPRQNDLPAVLQGSVSVRGSAGATIQVRSTAFVEAPEVRLALQIGCGFDLHREYVFRLAATTESVLAPVVAEPAVARAPRVQSPGANLPARPLTTRSAETGPSRRAIPAGKMTSAIARPPAAASGMHDRVVLMPPPGPVGDPGLLLDNELISWREDDGERETRRQLLRLEYRLLQAVYEQGQAQLDAAEKLRQLDATATELQRLGQTVADGKTEAASLASAPPGTVAPAPTSPAGTEPAPTVPPASVAAAVSSSVANEPPAKTDHIRRGLVWAFLALLLAGLIAWPLVHARRVRARKAASRRMPIPEPYIDPARDSELDHMNETEAAPAPRMETSPDGLPVLSDQLTAKVGAIQEGSAPLAPAPAVPAHHPEQMEAQPVMELADIMLSFGRIKGAAQALQEFVDQNPEDALQPWIRLMDVYRVAGMRSEFERVAAELNQHFNVEIQRWESLAAKNAPAEASQPVEPLPIAWHTTARENRSIEDLEHIADRVTQLWPGAECRAYLEQLLRDTRGGQRSGFSMPIVEELMFLIELLETLAKMDEDMAGR